MKIQVTDLVERFAKDIHGKGLLSKIYKELLKLKIRKQTTQLKMGQGLPWWCSG